jgi:hypothetical protein
LGADGLWFRGNPMYGIVAIIGVAIALAALVLQVVAFRRNR